MQWLVPERLVQHLLLHPPKTQSASRHRSQSTVIGILPWSDPPPHLLRQSRWSCRITKPGQDMFVHPLKCLCRELAASSHLQGEGREQEGGLVWLIVLLLSDRKHFIFFMPYRGEESWPGQAGCCPLSWAQRRSSMCRGW